MTTVGIRELKAHLSSYLRLVQNGESVVVTDRGREIAVIETPGTERDALRRLMDSGLVRWSGGKPSVPDGPPVKIQGEPISKTVLDLRKPE